jgi:hypothetical protein
MVDASSSYKIDYPTTYYYGYSYETTCSSFDCQSPPATNTACGDLSSTVNKCSTGAPGHSYQYQFVQMF